MGRGSSRRGGGGGGGGGGETAEAQIKEAGFRFTERDQSYSIETESGGTYQIPAKSSAEAKQKFSEELPAAKIKTVSQNTSGFNVDTGSTVVVVDAKSTTQLLKILKDQYPNRFKQ